MVGGLFLYGCAHHSSRGVFSGAVILCAADRNYEIMHARFPPGSRIFGRFWIRLLYSMYAAAKPEFRRLRDGCAPPASRQQAGCHSVQPLDVRV